MEQSLKQITNHNFFNYFLKVMELNTKRKRVRRKKRKRRKKRRKGKKIEKEMRKEKKERNAKNWKISPPWPKELLTATDARDHHGIETAEILVVKGKNCYFC